MLPDFISNFARDLEEKQREMRLRDRSGLWRPAATPATDLGYRCDRRVVYHRTQPELARPISAELASIFTEGNLHQRHVRQELAELGFEAVDTESSYRDDDLEISGTIDGKIEIPIPDGWDPKASGAEIRHGKIRVPVEIKSMTGQGPRTQHEWQFTDKPLLRRYFAQLQGYMVLTPSPYGLGLFKDKITGLWTVCPVALDYEDAEGLLQRAERVRDAVRLVKSEGEQHLPPRLADRSECATCPWKDTACHPAEEDIDPMLLVEDQELLEQLNERAELDPKRKRFADVDKHIKERFKLTKGDRWVAGNADDGYLVTRKMSKSGSHLIKIKRLDTEVDTKE